VASNGCRLRWCPICSKARSYHITEAVLKWIEGLKVSRFLTLTYAHSDAPLHHQIESLYKHFRQFRKRPLIKRNIQGGIWFFQVKKSTTDGKWHPHIHILTDSKYLDKSIYSQEWFATTKNSSIIDIRLVRNKKKSADYVARYAARPATLSEMSLTENIEVVTALHGKRLFGKWGSAKDCQIGGHVFAEAADWQKVGSYKHCIEHYFTDNRAKKIIDTWQNDGELPENVYFFELDDNKSRELNPDMFGCSLDDIELEGVP